jgi:hypothetical protein
MLSAMRASLLSIAILTWLLAAACGQGTTDVSSASTGPAGGATSSGTTGPGDPGGAGGTAGTGGTAGGATGGDAAGGAGGGTAGGAGGGTTPVGEPVVLAFHVDGRYPTVRVFKGDPVNDRCTIVRLAMLGMGGGDDPSFAAVARPEGWGVEYVLMTKGFDDCHEFNQAVENELEGAVGASGSVSFGEWPPDVLDIDVAITFAAAAPWVPAQETISATGLPVELW